MENNIMENSAVDFSFLEAFGTSPEDIALLSGQTPNSENPAQSTSNNDVPPVDLLPPVGNVYERGHEKEGQKAPENGNPNSAVKIPEAKTSETPEEVEEEFETPGVFKATKPATPEVKDIDAGVSLVKEKLGFDLSDPKGYTELAEKFNALKGEVESSVEAVKTVETMKSAIAGLPEPVKAAIRAYERGENFEDAFLQTVGKAIDYSLPVDKQPVELLIKNYAAGIITPEEYADDPNSRESVSALALAKEKFNLNQRVHNEAKQREANEKQSLARKYGEGIETSYAEAKKSFPNANAPELQSIYAAVKDGKFDEFFMNEEGILKPDAIQKLVYAEYGRAMIESQSKTIEKLKTANKQLSNQLAETVGKGNGRVPESTKASPGVSPAVVDQGNSDMEWLNGFQQFQEQKKNPY